MSEDNENDKIKYYTSLMAELAKERNNWKDKYSELFEKWWKQSDEITRLKSEIQEFKKFELLNHPCTHKNKYPYMNIVFCPDCDKIINSIE